MYVRMWVRVAWSHVWWIFLGRVVGGSASMIDICLFFLLRVEFLLKTDSGYPNFLFVVRSFSHFLFLRHRIMCWPGPLPKG